MTFPLLAAVALGVIALVVAVVIAGVGRAGRRRARREAEAAALERAALEERLAALEERLAAVQAPGGRPRGDDTEYVITSLGRQQAGQPPVPAIPASAFADQVVRETVVYAAAAVQGVRRALSPETRNRIRFEMRRELRRARKSRKIETREALREYRARHRAEVPVDHPGAPRRSSGDTTTDQEGLSA